MKTIWLGVFLGAAFASAASAQEPSPLVQGKGCLSCHDVSQAKIGPSFTDIAAQYKGQADAPAKLAGELKNGTGHPKINASDAELQQLVAEVLATP